MHGWDVRRSEGEQSVPEHTVDEFLALCRNYSPDKLATDVFKNRQRTSSSSGILKADAVVRFVEVLAAHGIQRLDDMKDKSKTKGLDDDLRKVHGQSSGITSEYFFMLAGSTAHVKADSMVCRFVGEAINADKSPAKPETARQLLKAVAEHLGVDPKTLDYGIWNYQRTRPMSRKRKLSA